MNTGFELSLDQDEAPHALDPALRALWWATKGDWDRAHACAQEGEGDRGCDLVHAHLHRVQGDLSNARYWYRRAGAPVSTEPFPQERQSILSQLLSRPPHVGDPT
jgi:hypothetical protein